MSKKADVKFQTRILSLLCMLLAGLSFLAPVWPAGDIASQIGLLTVWVGIIEIYHGFRRNSRISRRNAMYSGVFSIFLGILLINAVFIQQNAVKILIVVVFIIESIRYFRNYLQQLPFGGRRVTFDLLAGLGNSLLVLGIFLFSDKGLLWIVSIVFGLRMIGIGLNILAARVGELSQVSEDIVRDLGYGDNAELTTLAQAIEDDEERRAPYDSRWIGLFIALLFFIHLGRMGLDRSFLGLLSPVVATIGDMVMALIIAYAIIWPLRMGFKKISLWIDRKLWRWVLAPYERTGLKKWIEKIANVILTKRIRTLIQFRKAGYSFRTAVRTGLRLGLPWAALLAAIMPVLGMSWYFDTENWASGIWDRWAAARTDTWRKAMIEVSGEDVNNAAAFKLTPEGVTDSTDFSFVVIGDPGEGDPSQLILKDQIVKVTNHPDVKFLVISSDIVYPSGALKDYERKFWLPFKGVEKPVYAIPGNHDWYDALEGFNATFLTPEAAKKAMLARIYADLEITSTSEKHIDGMIAKSRYWQQEYGVPTGFQNAPIFQVATDDFVLITLETGVLRQLDTLQMAWLKTVLEASKDKFVMVMLGHPFYAIGEYQGSMNPEFEALHQLLRQYKVPLIMAGDTHDLEYYVEPQQGNDGHTMHHFVNGGGGAYLSIGIAMADSAKIPTDDFAFYPSRGPLVQKIEDLTAWYKYPAWWYTKKFNGWPFSAEWLSAAFDYNQAPFFQSFMEIKVEKSKGQVRLLPYSNHGRLRWTELTATPLLGKKAGDAGEFVEWVIPMK